MNDSSSLTSQLKENQIVDLLDKIIVFRRNAHYQNLSLMNIYFYQNEWIRKGHSFFLFVALLDPLRFFTC